MKISLSTHPEKNNFLLIRSLKLYRYSIQNVFFLSLLISLFLFLPQLVIQQNYQQLWLLLTNLSILILFTALLWRIRCVVTDAHEKIRDDIKIALKKFPYILVATLLLTAFLFIFNFLIMGIIYLIATYNDPANAIVITWKDTLFADILIALQTILVSYLCVAVYFYLPIIVIEHEGILPSLKKSIRLVWKNWWRTFTVQITPWIAYVICLFLLKYAIESLIPRNLTLSVFMCSEIILFAFFIPWIASLLMIQLHDLELRKA